MMHEFNGCYTEEHLNHVAFPLGGIGAGMICMEGTGALSHVSLRHQPEMFHEPVMFAALCVKGHPGVGNTARVLEGPVPRWKIFGQQRAGLGLGARTYGLPRFKGADFIARMPFGEVRMRDKAVPVEVKVTGWSPFVPTDADASSLPMAGLEYELSNVSAERVDAIFSYHMAHVMAAKSDEAAPRQICRMENGFVLHQPGRAGAIHEEGSFAVAVDDAEAHVDAAWFRGGWFDARTILWNHVSGGDIVDHEPHKEGDCGAGASIYVPFTLQPGEKRTMKIRMGWYVPHSQERCGPEKPTACDDESCHYGEAPRHHQPWYAGRFGDVEQVMTFWKDRYAELRAKSSLFSECFYAGTLPPEVVEAVAVNLTILKSPTVLRNREGRLWGWEGCDDSRGCCSGSCTHVWNYAQAVPHLFPGLERTLRETEFGESQNEEGKQSFRSALPIRPITDFSPHAAADGQLGGVMKMYREWRLSGDLAWMKRMWPAVRQSLDYCIATWDPNREGVLREPHHNTYDIEFWGADAMCSSFYLGALKAAVLMGIALGDDVADYDELYRKGRVYVETELFNGSYFQQEVQWKNLNAALDRFSPVIGGKTAGPQSMEAQALVDREGPKYQYGSGCLSDGVLGAWMAMVCGVGEILDVDKIRSHLLSVHRHNLRKDLSDHANPQRPGYAVGEEGGLLLCTWPRGGKPSLPFVYSDEVWTGIEYQVASHLIGMGCMKEGLEIVRVARSRYDGRDRNPFNEYECGHWYARAMSSYALLGAISGASYDAVTGTLSLQPRIGGDFAAFFSTSTGFGLVGVRNGEPFLDVRYGKIEIKHLAYRVCNQ